MNSLFSWYRAAIELRRSVNVISGEPKDFVFLDRNPLAETPQDFSQSGLGETCVALTHRPDFAANGMPNGQIDSRAMRLTAKKTSRRGIADATLPIVLDKRFSRTGQLIAIVWLSHPQTVKAASGGFRIVWASSSPSRTSDSLSRHGRFRSGMLRGRPVRASDGEGQSSQ